jgi:two-component system cell cycle sensor histidine kinase/response regulator CckA
MTKKNIRPRSAVELRRQAEEIARGKAARTSKDRGEISPEEARQVLHELQVHQIELEMQNEELRTAQEELDSARARYFDLYDLAPVGYSTISESGLILEANLTAATMLGMARGALVKQSFGRFILKEDQDIYYLHRKRLFETESPQKFELRMTGKDGTVLWVNLEAAIARDPVTSPKGPPVCRIVMSDITVRKRTEEALQNEQKLESLAVLAGGIAHDFNNIFAGVFGYIELAIGKVTDENVAGYLKKSLSVMDRARGLTGQLLTFAKGGDPVQKTTSLVPFIQETILSALRGTDVSCRFTIVKKLQSCNIDKNQIGQVIDNIISNARQAMPPVGTIECNAQNVYLGENEHPTLTKGAYVKISIKDCGIGMPRQLLSHIFNPFFSTKEKGQGLGLSTSHSIITRHGGCIDVESELGKGSTFHLYLPSSAEPALSDTVTATDVKHRGAGRIIVMDEEEILRDTFGNMFEALGYAVICNSDGREAVEYFIKETEAGRTITAIFLDLTVPGGMGGKEAVMEIRKRDTTIPVFVVSGYSDDPVMRNPVDFGFTAGICKPFSMNELENLLEKHLKTHE